MKIINFVSDNILFLLTLFLLIFIPLYPKFPLIDVKNTWVYVRLEDFLIAGVYVIWLVQLIRRKISFITPLTIPIAIFWGVGLISLLYAVEFIFPTLPNLDISVAFLHFLRRIEYLGMFFVAFSSLKDKKYLPYVIFVLTFTLLLVIAYGYGQKLDPVHFPAFSTMNEEFAKGTPLRLSSKARIPSTFAGHYDLAVYLVMMIAILGSLVFAFKKLYLSFIMLISSILALVLLLLTASRVSFVVYLISISFMLLLQKKKWLIIPVIILSIILSNYFQGITERFGSTISQVDLVVDARTGKAIGIAKKPNPREVKKKPIVIEDIQSTGENLPQGSGYIIPQNNEPQQRIVTQIFRSRLIAGSQSAEITSIEGDFVLKKALAYDVSFTTRFQGEWPRALEAFKRNIFLGSGYSSISDATDNNFLRILGEVGVLGLSSFILIFLIFGISIYRILPFVGSPLDKSFVIGVSAGVFGVGLNAILIDAFEASKVAYVFWILIGLCVGLLYVYNKQKVHYLTDLRKILTSNIFLVIYLLIATFVIYVPSVSNYFRGDDFSILRSVADCKKVLYQSGVVKCEPFKNILINYFLDSGDFTFRPGNKLYFNAMYSIFWLNPFVYHVMSTFFHFIVVAVLFLLSLRLTKNKAISFIASLFFVLFALIVPTVLSISNTGDIIVADFIFLALLMHIFFKEKRNIFFVFLSLLSIFAGLLFHEVAIIAPLLILLYDFYKEKGEFLKNIFKRYYYALYLLTFPIYVLFRSIIHDNFYFIILGRFERYYVSTSILFVVMIFIFSSFIKRIIPFNKISASIILSIIVLIIFIYQVVVLQKINENYSMAGEISNKLLITFNDVYSKKIPQNPVFYFVDVPKTIGSASVFSKGLPDALWFTFQNENLNVFVYENLEAALDAAEGSGSAKVFDFQNNGSVEEITRTKTIVPIKK